jgi:hypothetical protein
MEGRKRVLAKRADLGRPAEQSQRLPLNGDAATAGRESDARLGLAERPGRATGDEEADDALCAHVKEPVVTTMRIPHRPAVTS